MPPDTPSQVFFGDTRGTKGWEPNSLPKNRAPLSVYQANKHHSMFIAGPYLIHYNVLSITCIDVIGW